MLIIVLIIMFVLLFRPIHIAAVQGEVEIVARLIEIMSKINISIDLTNNLKQVMFYGILLLELLFGMQFM